MALWLGGHGARAVEDGQLEAIVAQCPLEWQTYIRNCVNTEVALLRGQPIGMPRFGATCQHSEFACLERDHAARTRCHRLCVVAVAFAQLSIFVETAMAGDAHSASTLMMSLQQIAAQLPQGCSGNEEDSACEPVLPTGWLNSAVDFLGQTVDRITAAEVTDALSAQQIQSAGREIAVVTAYYQSPSIWEWSNDSETAFSGEAPMPWYLKNKACYAEKHGYKFVFRQEAPGIDLNAEVDGYRHSIHWIKLAAVREALRSHDWVFWIDYDALFSNFSQTLEQFIDEAEAKAPVDLIVQDSVELICPNAFLIRSSRWSFNFLDTWEKYGRMPVPGRSKMWELRCFNCALVDHAIVTKSGKTLRRCGELPSHVYFHRRLLDKHGFGWWKRRLNPVIGKIYFWDTRRVERRGFLFNVNDAEHQTWFKQADLYHVGDLALHWPKPNKDTPVMREFANELADHPGCAAWTRPLVASPEAYQPMGVAEAPAVFTPGHLIIAFLARFAQVTLALLSRGAELKRLLYTYVLRNLVGKTPLVDALLGEPPTPLEKKNLWDAYNVRLRAEGSLAELPSTVAYDFVFVGVSLGTDVYSEVGEGLARLIPGAVLAVPLIGCGHQPEADPSYEELQSRYPQAVWRRTRDTGDIDLGGPRTDPVCVWAYAQNTIADDDYRKAFEKRGIEPIDGAA
eukprot:TRINITY_DN40751_c0_g1_i1.p1 TRINITY_DN40751_c0_g1~~TRINITY_DN40751_c0_g1_i1.p1  ORF type:complete len:710 (-),score=113.32 TRINITY_DN40751_c0_g1_i1:91-2130(-)